MEDVNFSQFKLYQNDVYGGLPADVISSMRSLMTSVTRYDWPTVSSHRYSQKAIKATRPLAIMQLRIVSILSMLDNDGT